MPSQLSMGHSHDVISDGRLRLVPLNTWLPNVIPPAPGMEMELREAQSRKAHFPTCVTGAGMEMEVKEVQRSSGLELENVLFALEKTNLDMSISLTNQSNLALTAHLQNTMAHNIQLETDKKNLILELQNNLRDEKWYHENAIAVEAQRPFEITVPSVFSRFK